MGSRHLRVDPNGLENQVNCVLGAARLLSGHARHVERIEMIRLETQYFPIQVPGLIELAGLVQLHGPFELLSQRRGPDVLMLLEV